MKKEILEDLSIGFEFDEGTVGYHELWFSLEDIMKLDSLHLDVSNVETIHVTFVKYGKVEE